MASASPTATAPASPPPSNYTLADEFDTLNARWGRHWGPFGDSTWDRANTSVSNGILSIQAVRGWSGDLIDTLGTFEQQYGHFEARIRIPKGMGLWPAFWLARPPAAIQPPEIDIDETCANELGTRGGLDAGWLNTTVHFAGSGQADQGFRVADMSTGFHVYGLDWRPDHIAWLMDGTELWRYTGPNIPDVAMPVILDLAVGGSWCGPADATTPSPSVMSVDWLHVSP